MSMTIRAWTHASRALVVAAATTALAITASAALDEARAQQPAAKAAEGQTAWVKLCEKVQAVRKDKDGKETKEDKNLCLTTHERLDGGTGMVLVSAAVRQLEGVDRQHLMIMVPLGMALPPNMRAAIYPKDLWEKAAKNEKVDDKQLKPLELKYNLCHPAGCTAETEIGVDVLEAMKTGGGLMVLAINAGGQPIGFPVPLEGFGATIGGKATDNEQYKKARVELMKQIQERQEQLLKQYQEEQAKQGAGAAPAKK